ncbi:hypothetical protein CPB83DRAFT_937269 [Crepidotus variabilis]|uniref:Uncharacterized protein n=1 Tax=Crepidotus variabilis TaxID=179855 RepID=A0A9P6JND4_9AGAR|nr:hypothetical protein CPB83DRAFT_937269 [Crepidotus variabilis]
MTPRRSPSPRPYSGSVDDEEHLDDDHWYWGKNFGGKIIEFGRYKHMEELIPMNEVGLGYLDWLYTNCAHRYPIFFTAVERFFENPHHQEVHRDIGQRCLDYEADISLDGNAYALSEIYEMTTSDEEFIAPSDEDENDGASEPDSLSDREAQAERAWKEHKSPQKNVISSPRRTCRSKSAKVEEEDIQKESSSRLEKLEEESAIVNSGVRKATKRSKRNVKVVVTDSDDDDHSQPGNVQQGILRESSTKSPPKRIQRRTSVILTDSDGEGS